VSVSQKLGRKRAKNRELARNNLLVRFIHLVSVLSSFQSQLELVLCLGGFHVSFLPAYIIYHPDTNIDRKRNTNRLGVSEKQFCKDYRGSIVVPYYCTFRY
jgi:hypothetical protein